MNKITFISFIILTLVACGRNDKAINNGKQKELQMQNKEKIISELTDKYKIKFNWDSLNFKYSFQYDKIIESGYQLIDYIDITDIYYKDSISYVSFRTWSWPPFYFDVTVSQDMINKIIQYQSKNNSLEGADIVLVVKIAEIKKIKLKIDSYSEDESDCNLELRASNGFIGKGEIVDLIIIN